MPSLKNNDFRASQVIMILRIIIVFDVLMIVFDLMELQLIYNMMHGKQVGLHAERHNEVRQLLMSIFYTIVSFCSGLAFWGWLHRSYSNINRIGFEKTKFNPVWTILSFLIPVINLYLPYMIVKETYNKNRTTLEQIEEHNVTGNINPVISWWWTLWLLSILSGVVYLLLLRLPLTRDNRLTLSSLSIFSDVIDIPAAFLAIMVIQRIHAFEQQLFGKSKPGNTESGG